MCLLLDAVLQMKSLWFRKSNFITKDLADISSQTVKVFFLPVSHIHFQGVWLYMKQEVLHEVTHREFSYIPRVMASVEIKSKSSLAKTETDKTE